MGVPLAVKKVIPKLVGFLSIAALITTLGSSSAGAKSSGETSNYFDIRLMHKMAAERADKNLLLSPYSVSTALKMAMLGANGETKQAMATTLDVSGTSPQEVQKHVKSVMDSLRNPGGSTQLAIANALFGAKNIKFKPEFLKDNKTFYSADATPVDFSKNEETVGIINSWVKQQTRGKIPTILGKVSPRDVLYLVNAIYFKGKWQEPFQKEQTKKEKFNLLDGTKKDVDMMHAWRKMSYMETPEFQAVDLPYADGRLSLTVFLPKKQSSLKLFETKMSKDSWSNWMKQFHSLQGHLGMPRFKIEDNMMLKDALSAMGMAVAFDPQKANFKRMTDISENIYISKVIHKTFMEVNEEGTEAAAVTAIGMEMTSARVDPVKPFEMVLNRPFFIALRDKKTDSVLFMGHVVKP